MDTHIPSEFDLSSSSALGAPDPFADSFATSYAGVIAFLAVAAAGSFSRAADRLGIGRSAVSRNVRKLEEQLDTRLFQRTTRSTSLTREGELFYQNCRPGMERIARALDDMRELRAGPPKGHLRIQTSTAFGRRIIAPLLPRFHTRFPDITTELRLSDDAVDFAQDRIDVAFVEGRLEDSGIVARQLMPLQTLTCASPSYMACHGLPRTIGDLERHRCIAFRSAAGRIRNWAFQVDGQPRTYRVPSFQIFNDLDLALQAALRGQGIAQLPAYLASGAIRSGKLAACLSQYAPGDTGHYLCYLSRKHLPSRIRAFVDYVVEEIRGPGMACLDASESAPTACY
ncbi:LysR family transcriptional regulator [Pusillimonas noertemannii]|uniref:LysR family transcriptional regulator n=1 Tax=Pusillimonas noertemannii TaxID=305977 RepID=UPI0002D7494A|nr:LysR family transcriptional regulator [Pusillimonas noertemannii]